MGARGRIPPFRGLNRAGDTTRMGKAGKAFYGAVSGVSGSLSNRNASLLDYLRAVETGNRLTAVVSGVIGVFTTLAILCHVCAISEPKTAFYAICAKKLGNPSKQIP